MWAGISDPFLNENYYTPGFSGHVTVTFQTRCVVIFIENRIGDTHSHIFEITIEITRNGAKRPPRNFRCKLSRI